jgi:hypothetical protein
MRGKSNNLPTTLPARFRDGFAWRLDRRSKVVREIAADIGTLWQDLGGFDAISAQERILCERVVFLRRRLLDHEQSVMGGGPPLLEPHEHVAGVNALLGLLKALGLTRRARDFDDLRAYLREQADEPATQVNGGGDGN